MRLFHAALASCLIVASPAFAQDRPAAGTIDFVEGDAMIETKDKQSRIAKLADAVYAGETITTFPAAELHLKMADGGYLSLRESTKITLTEYVANGGDGDRSLIDLAKGAFRSITGWIGKYRRDAYKVRTPIVTIGVRGTDHEPTHFEPGDPRGEPGSYDKVNEGRTVMQSKFGAVEVPANRAAHFRADQRAAPKVLQTVPTFFKPSRNEQRFVERGRQSARTLDTQRTALREKRAVQKSGLDRRKPEGKAVERKAPERPRLEKRSERPATPPRLERKLAEKKDFQRQPRAEKKAFEKKRFEKKSAERRRFEKK